MENPANKGGAVSVDDLLGGDHQQNTATSRTLQVYRLVSRFSLPVATATVVAEIAFTTEAMR
ncbi:hypothetical protein [Bradyrhizobium stylosanthis]|uniref:hypothetical protein n=1 Tax=Bradyrhizobium stylosanthis TaxID=1803665 RepID=UPI0007C4D30A|nr:hypothetical protein [Bradyrhizobium stylosanthis]